MKIISKLSYRFSPVGQYVDLDYISKIGIWNLEFLKFLNFWNLEKFSNLGPEVSISKFSIKQSSKTKGGKQRLRENEIFGM